MHNGLHQGGRLDPNSKERRSTRSRDGCVDTVGDGEHPRRLNSSDALHGDEGVAQFK